MKHTAQTAPGPQEIQRSMHSERARGCLLDALRTMADRTKFKPYVEHQDQPAQAWAYGRFWTGKAEMAELSERMTADNED